MIETGGWQNNLSANMIRRYGLPNFFEDIEIMVMILADPITDTGPENIEPAVSTIADRL